MLRLILSVLLNAKRGPKVITTMRKMTKHPERYSEEKRFAYALRLIRYLKDSVYITTEVYGLDKLPKEGGYVMFPNHQGKYDAVSIMYAHHTPCTFVMDKAKSYGFLVRELVDLVGAKRLDLHNVRQNVKIIDAVTEEVKNGKKYILFSEGGYDHNGNKVQTFKPGSFKSAVKAKAPIVPVAIIDSYLAFNSFKLGAVTTKVIFIDPLYYDDYKELKTPAIANEVKYRIMKAMQEHGIHDNDDEINEFEEQL